MWNTKAMLGAIVALASITGVAQAAHPDHAAAVARGYQPMRASGKQPPIAARVLTMAQGQAHDPSGHAAQASWMPNETNAIQVVGLGKTRVRVASRPTLWDPTGTNAGANYTTPGLHTKLKLSTPAGEEDELQVQIPVSFHHHLPGDQFADANTYTLELVTHAGTADQTTHRLTGIPSAGRITPVTLKGHLGDAFALTMWPEGSAGLGGYLNGRKATGERE